MSPEIPFDQLLVLWQDDASRLRHADAPQRRVMDQIIDALVLELRRRVGARFSTDELADLYMAGTDWCFEVARATNSHMPEAWDMPVLIGSAFSRYVRAAQDFGGGRRRSGEEDE